MLNITARIAVRIKRVPDWSFEWSDITPQRSLDSLTTVDFLPSEQDGDELKKRAVRYMKQFLVNEFNSLTHLKHRLDLVYYISSTVMQVQKLYARPYIYSLS